MKTAIAASCVLVICIGGGIALGLQLKQKEEREQDRREFELKLLHYTNLAALYEQINHNSFGDQLPPDISVSWADLHSNPYCVKCAAMTNFDTAKPRIWIDSEKVRTQEFLRKTMQHEMCHVAVNEAATKIGEAAVREVDHDPHGPLWQECMKRFE